MPTATQPRQITTPERPSAPGSGWPSQCEICRRWARARICPTCTQRFAPPVTRCGRCALPLSAAQLQCGACTLSPPAFVQTICAVDYAFPWDQLIINFKFRQQPELAGPLSQRLLQAVQHGSGGLPDILLPVPLSPQRLAQRGYNQAWELARRLGQGLHVQALPQLLQRLLDTPHQAELSRQERLHNLRNAFMVAPASAGLVQGRHVALVDDVMTTGATAQEAAAELLRNGARRVDLWVLARTAAPGN